MFANFVLSFLVIILTVFLIRQGSFVALAKRKRTYLSDTHKKEQADVTAILRISSDIISQDESEDIFFRKSLARVVESMHGSGGALIKCGPDGEISGCAVSGTMPPIQDIPAKMREHLTSHPDKHDEFFHGLKLRADIEELNRICQNGYAFYSDSAPAWFSRDFLDDVPAFLLAPIKWEEENYAYILITSGYQPSDRIFKERDSDSLLPLCAAVSLGLDFIKVYEQKKADSAQLREAREANIAQITDAVFQAIGNTATAALFTAKDLEEQLSVHENVPENDKRADASAALNRQLNRICEIIDLHNQATIRNNPSKSNANEVLDFSIRFFKEAFIRRGIRIDKQLEGNLPELHINTALLSQALINLMENALKTVDSCDAKEEKVITLKSQRKTLPEFGEAVVIDILCGASGTDNELQENLSRHNFTDKKQEQDNHAICSGMAIIKEAGGIINVTAREKGSAFSIIFPLGENKKKLPDDVPDSKIQDDGEL